MLSDITRRDVTYKESTLNASNFEVVAEAFRNCLVLEAVADETDVITEPSFRETVGGWTEC